MFKRPLVALLIGLCAPARAAVPNTPINIDPPNGIWLEYYPTLVGSNYSDPDSNPQVAAEFEVRTSTGTYGDATSFGSGVLGPVDWWDVPLAAQSVTYYWHVRYRDAEGWSAWSAETSYSYDNDGPTTPPWVTVGPTAATGVFTVDWGLCTDPDSGVFGYDVGLKEFPSPYQYPTLLASDPYWPPPILPPQTITIGPGTYTVRVRAVDNADNHSNWLESTPEFTVVADVAVPVLEAPTVGASPTRNPISLSWTADASAVSYLISRSTDSGLTWRQVKTVAAPTTSTTNDPGVSATYVYRIAIAWADRVGEWSAPSASVLYDIDRPSTLSDLTVLPAINNGIPFTLTWTDAGDVGGSGVVRFNVRRAPQGSSSWTTLPDVFPPTTTTTDTPPSDGRWQYRVRAVDAAGNTSYWTTRTVTYDTTPPSAPGQPSAPPSPGPVPLTWAAATDATSGVASYTLERSTDGVSFAPIATGLATPSYSDAVSEGMYWYRVYAIDAAAWVGPLSPVSLPTIVDATTPNAPTGISATPALSADGQITISWTDNGDPLGGGVASGIAFFEIQRAPAGSGTWTLLGTTPAASPALDAPADGPWDYQVRAVDAAGNRSGWSGTATATADTTPPVEPGAPVPVPLVTNGTVSLTWAAATDATSGVASYTLERSSDGGITWIPVAADLPGTSTTDAPFDGQYLYRVLATDVAGHTSAPSLPSVAVLVDRTAPSIPTSPSVSPPLSVSGQLTVSWTNAGDPLNGGVASGVVAFEIRRAPGGTGTWTVLTPPAGVSPLVDAPPSDGDWDYQIRALDLAGNVSGWSATATASVDTTAPSAPGEPVPTPTTTNGTVSLTWTAATDATSGVASYELDRSADGGATWASVATGIPGTSTTDAPATDGRYVYRVRATDVAGNTGARSPVSVDVVIDKTAPSTPAGPAVSPPLSNDGQLTVSWTDAGDPPAGGVSSGVVRFEIQRAPGGTGTWTILGTSPAASPLIDTAPSDGDWDYQVRAVDAAGNLSAWTATVTGSCDTTPPTAPGTPVPDVTLTSGSVTLTWTAATDTGTGVASYELERSADGGATWTSAAAGIVGLSASDAPAADGQYLYRVRATDSAGNVGPASPSSAAVVVDKTAPSTPTSPAVTPALSGDGQLTVSWTDAGDPPAGGVSSGVVRFDVRRAPGGTGTWTVLGTSPVASPLVDTAPGDGDWDYQVRAVDAAGNVSAWSVTATGRVDTTPPGTPGAPVPTPTLANGPISLSWAAASDATSGVASYDLERSGDGGVTWTTVAFDIPGTSTTDAPLDGQYLYRVRATDLAGHTGAPSLPSVQVTVDLTAPFVPTSPAVSPALSGDGMLTVSWVNAGDPLNGDVASGVVRFEIRRSPGGMGTWTILGASPPASPLVDTPGTDGDWDYQIRAVDAAGNLSGWTATVSGRIDTVPPSAPGAPVPAATTVSGPVSLNWTAATDATSGVASYELERSANGGATWTSAATGIAGTSATDAPSDGQYLYRVRAVDAADHQGAFSPASVQILVDLTPPSVPTSPAVSPPASGDGVLTVSWTDAGDPLAGGVASGVDRFEIQRSPGGMGAWTLLPTTPAASPLVDIAPGDGDWDYQVRAVDAAGNRSAWSATASASVSTGGPSAPGAPVPAATPVSGPVSLAWTPSTGASPIDFYELQRSADNGATWTSAATGLPGPSATDAPPDGSYLYRARATDTLGHVGPFSANSVQVVVDTAPPSAPGAPVPAVAVTRDPVSLSWTAATDATSGVASYSLERSTDLAAWSGVASGIASTSYSDPAPEGAFYYRAVAFDAAANIGPPSTASVQVIVDKTPPQTPAAPTAGPTPSAGPVTVSWDAVSDVGLAGMASYRVERSPDGSAWVPVATVPSTTTTYDDTPPTGTWVYRVVALDAAGNEAASPASSQVQVDSTPSRLVFTTGPLPVNVGQCVPLAVETRNALDVPAPPAADLTVTLGGSASVSLFSDGACATPAGSVVILAGTTQVAYSWSSSAAGTATLNASAPPLTGASQDYPVLQVQGGACSLDTECATGVCADFVCCDAACSGGCESCNQAGYAGTCRPWAAFTDPEAACGTGACAGTCDGDGACSYPSAATSCGTCQVCDGAGTCGNSQNGTSCADTSYCNGEELCQDGACQPGTAITCPPSGQDVVACDESSQSCQVQSQSPPVIVRDAHLDGAVGVPYAYNALGAVTALGPRPMQFAACAGPPELRVESRTGAVSFVPAVAGSVSLCVQATNAYGTDSYSFTVQVAATAPEAPVARIVAANAVGIAPLTATLDGSTSTSADASPLHAFRWREGHFGPRRFTTAIDAYYLLPGGYLGELQVVDRAGRTGSAVQAILALTAQGHRPPSAQIVASALQGDGALEVDLSCACTAGDNPIRGLFWRVSTGETLQGPNAHVSLGPGRHHVLLEAVDAEGLSAFAKQELVVTSAGKLPPECEVTADPPAVAAPSPVTYEAALSPSSSDIASLELGAGTTTTDQPSLTLQENAPGRVETWMRIVDADGLACADVGLVRLTDSQSRLPPAIHSHASAQAICGIPYSYGTTPPVVSGTGAFGFSVQGAPAGLTVDPGTGEILWMPSSEQAGPQDFTLVATGAAGAASEAIHVDVACGPAANLQVACGCTSAGEAPLAIAALAIAWAAWRRRRSG